VLDRKLLRFLRTRGHSPQLERAALLYARAGESGLLWPAWEAPERCWGRCRVPLYAAVTLMALTRPYLGGHYPSDVVGGVLFGRARDRLL